MLSVNVCVETKALSLFCSIARDQTCIENQIAKRQLAVKDLNDTSWFSNIRRILNSYDLPSAYALLENPTSKDQWKKTVKSKIHSKIEECWRGEIKSKHLWSI